MSLILQILANHLVCSKNILQEHLTSKVASKTYQKMKYYQSCSPHYGKTLQVLARFLVRLIHSFIWKNISCQSLAKGPNDHTRLCKV